MQRCRGRYSKVLCFSLRWLHWPDAPLKVLQTQIRLLRHQRLPPRHRLHRHPPRRQSSIAISLTDSHSLCQLVGWVTRSSIQAGKASASRLAPKSRLVRSFRLGTPSGHRRRNVKIFRSWSFQSVSGTTSSQRNSTLEPHRSRRANLLVIRSSYSPYQLATTTRSQRDTKKSNKSCRGNLYTQPRTRPFELRGCLAATPTRTIHQAQ
jgi:hypothetical protein